MTARTVDFLYNLPSAARSPSEYCRNGLLVGALRARSFEIIGFLAGEAGLLGACSSFSDTLLGTIGLDGREGPEGRDGEGPPTSVPACPGCPAFLARPISHRDSIYAVFTT